MLEETGHFPDFKTLLFNAINMKNHSSSEETEVLKTFLKCSIKSIRDSK